MRRRGVQNVCREFRGGPVLTHVAPEFAPGALWPLPDRPAPRYRSGAGEARPTPRAGDWLPAPGPWPKVITFAVHRAKRDFSELARLYLNALRPHLAERLASRRRRGRSGPP
jgi:hypothetical protein